MATNITFISDYNPLSSDSFLFDNNVWIYLFCPLSDYGRDMQNIYSKFFDQILTAKSTVYTTSLVLAEFVNRCLRFDYNQWVKKPENIRFGSDFKKNFVGSASYKGSVESISINVRKILSLTEKYPDDFNAIEINDILSNLLQIDFNDAYFIQLAKRRNLKIITHDSDFFKPNLDVSVISGNRNCRN